MPLIPVLGVRVKRQRQLDLCEFKASLVYKVSSTETVTQSQKKKKKDKTKSLLTYFREGGTPSFLSQSILSMKRERKIAPMWEGKSKNIPLSHKIKKIPFHMTSHVYLRQITQHLRLSVLNCKVKTLDKVWDTGML